MSRPDGKPINYIDSAASNGDSYLTVQAYFHLTNISFTSSTFNVTLECGVNSSGIATGQTASFDNTQSFVNIYVNGNLITVTPAINIPAGYNSYYYISTSGSYTSTTIRFKVQFMEKHQEEVHKEMYQHPLMPHMIYELFQIRLV